MTLRKLYLKLLLIALFIGPLYWLLMTEHGTRMTDTILLGALGEDTMDMNLKVLDSSFSKTDLHKVYPDIIWHCRDQAVDFGNSACFTTLGALNGIPSRSITIYFLNDHVSALKLNYRPIHHESLFNQLVEQFGQPIISSAKTDTPSVQDGILNWRTDTNGLLVFKEQIREGEEAALIWLAAENVN